MDERSGMIYDIRKGSRLDGPGERTVVLFKGCSMDCWWCTHPELQSPGVELAFDETRCVRCGTCVTLCPVDAARQEDWGRGGGPVSYRQEVCIVCGACIGPCEGGARSLVGRRMTAAEVLAQIEPDAAALRQQGGVTFGGGEPLMQAAFLGDLLRACRALGLHTAVDTAGYAPWDAFERVRGDVDLFLYEIKLMDSELHRSFTGVPNEAVLSNLRRLAGSGAGGSGSGGVIVRVPLIPGVTDGEANLHAAARFCAGLPGVNRVELVPYQKVGAEHFTRAGAAASAQAVDIFAAAGLSARVVE